METGDSAAGYCDKHKAPDRCSGRMHIGKVAPDFRNHVIGIGQHTKTNTDCHDNKADTEYRINLSDDLIDRNKSCNKVVNKNHDQPEHFVGKNVCDSGIGEQQLDQSGRSYRKYGSYHNQQNNTENAHYVLHSVSKINSGNLGNGGTIVSFGKHT